VRRSIAAAQPKNGLLRQRVRAALLRIEGIVESPGIFYDNDAFWVNGKQIAHFRGDDAMEIRLTRRVISELRARLRAEASVTLRSGSSDWITVALEDMELIRELAERAAAAHRAPSGTTPKPPPVGVALERMRRFH
jgi:hypothetical protein